MDQHRNQLSITYPLGIEDGMVKRFMRCLTEVMSNGFAHYYLIESIHFKTNAMYIVTVDDIKEYVFCNNKFDYVMSHSKGSFKQNFLHDA